VGDAIFNKGCTPAGLDLYFSNVQDPVYVANVFLYVTHELIGDAIMVIPMFGIFLLADRCFVDLSTLSRLWQAVLGLCGSCSRGHWNVL
jgi:hypothetical protein